MLIPKIFDDEKHGRVIPQAVITFHLCMFRVSTKCFVYACHVDALLLDHRIETVNNNRQEHYLDCECD